MRRMICVVLFTLGLSLTAAGAARAGGSCPSGSVFRGGGGHGAGGVCLDLDSGDVVKTLRSR